MEPLSPEGLKIVDELARRYAVSTQAVTTLLQAVISGHGTIAQFSHPELGGPGRWSQGGMTMIGDMFNNSLKPMRDRCTFQITPPAVPDEQGRLVAGDCNAPNVLRMPFRLNLKATA